MSGPVATALAAGTCTITAAQGGNADWPAALPVTQLFQVNPLSQTITFDQPADTTAGKAVQLSAVASSKLPVSFSSDTPGTCTVLGPVATALAAGTCTITAAQGGSTAFAAALEVTRSFRVSPAAITPAPVSPAPVSPAPVHPAATPASQTIVFGQPPGTTVGKQVVLSASASSKLPVSFSSDTPGTCTASGVVVTTAAAGTCTITASQGGSAHFAPAPEVARSFQVNATRSLRANTGPWKLVGLLAAAVLAAAVTTATVAVRRLRSRSRPLPGSIVRADPHAGPLDFVSVHATGEDATHTVRIEPHPGVSEISTEEVLR